MSKRILKFLALCSLFLLLAATKEPKLVLEHVTHDFGTVKEGEKISTSFVLRNEGGAPLEINRIFPACGCTVAELSSNTIAPGEQAKLNVSFNTEGFYGFKVKTVRVFTNDPLRQTLVLSLQGKIERDVEIEPSRLYFGTLRKGDQKAVTAKISTAPGIRVLEIVPRSKFIELASKKNAQDGEKQVSLSLSPEIPVGVFRSRLVVKTSSLQNPVVNLPIFARVEGDVALSPSDISFGLLEGPLGEDQERVVVIENRSDKAVRVLKTSALNSLVRTELIEVKAGFLYRLKVVLPTSSSGIIRDKISIETDHLDAEQRVLELPVYGIVSEP